MTAPPRPEPKELRLVAKWLEEEERHGSAKRVKQAADYIEHLERELESAEAALDRMRERPDPDSWVGP